MIDPLTEETMPLGQAAKRVPRLRVGRNVHPSTLWRWATAGVKGVKLETVKVGATTCTSIEALGRFFAAVNGAGLALSGSKLNNKEQRKRTQHDLDAAGI